MDLWDAAGCLEASRHGRESALRNDGVDRYSEYFSFPDRAPACFSRDRSAVSTVARAVGAGSIEICSAAGALDHARRGAVADFLRDFHVHRLVDVRDRVRAGERRGLDAAGATDFAALLLPPDDVRGAVQRATRGAARPAGRLARRRDPSAT